MTEPIRVYGYHGTSIEAASVILKDGFKPSRNAYDWLGDGIYFWEDAPQRAWDWAIKQYAENAAVVASIIRIEDCMDFKDIAWFNTYTEAYDSFIEQLKRSNLPFPIQKSKNHRADRAVINYCVGILEQRGIKVRVVRGVFPEGVPAFPTSAIFSHSHVQIAVRDESLIEQSELLER